MLIITGHETRSLLESIPSRLVRVGGPTGPLRRLEFTTPFTAVTQPYERSALGNSTRTLSGSKARFGEPS
jgi:hypothetical protein